MIFESILLIFFILFLFLFLFTWILYPLLLIVIKLLRPKLSNALCQSQPKFFPKVSFIISAYNEQAHIKERIENLINLDYPEDKIEIITASDGSTDRTNQIVEEIYSKDERVILIPFKAQRGRAHIHNESVKRAKGDIIVFTDAQTSFAADFLKILVPYFSDSKVGAVSGRVYYKNTDQSSITESAGIYWKYEESIRKLESDIGVLSFGTGAGLAIRKEAYSPIKITTDIDCAATLNAKLKGYAVKYAPLAKLFDYIEVDSKQAHIARIRKTSLAFGDVLSRLVRISPLRNPMLFISVFFHKTSRHLTPFYMIAIFITNIFLLNKREIFLIAFLFQLLFYGFALIGWILEKNKKKVVPFYVPYNFVLLNAGRFIGVFESILGKKMITYNN